MQVEQLGSGMGFTEGPVWRQDGDVVVTSIDRGHLYAIGQDRGPRLLAVTGGGPNGATEGPGGVIYVTQNGGRGLGWRRPVSPGGIQAVRPDGAVEWVSLDPIEPNDLCFGPDGLLYATDPTRRRGADGRWRLHDDGRIWRIDVETHEAVLLLSVAWYPNGIGFGLEDDAIYVASTSESRIVRFPLGPSGLGRPETVIQMDHGTPDGFAFDVEGNCIVAAVGSPERRGDIQVWSREGKLLDIFEPGDNWLYTNVALSAERRLIITDSLAGAVLIAEDWPHAGLALHPFRPAQRFAQS